MAGEGRAAPHPLGGVIGRLAADPHPFDFFAAIRRVQCEHPARPRIGRSHRLADDPVRFGQEPSLAFAPAAISACNPPDGEVPARILVAFLGLLGPNGPLPLHLTEFARDRLLNAGDRTFARFLDIFNHRMVSLFYRAWEANTKTASHDRPADDRFAVYVASLIGLGFPSLMGRDAVPDRAKLFYSGHLAAQTRHREGLESIIADDLAVPCRIEEFVGQWLELPADARCRLGRSPATGSLGSTAVVGSRIWDCQQRFRLRLGPMSLIQYERLLPGGDSLRRVHAWAAFYTGHEKSWEVQLVLLAREVPAVRLGRAGRLGWTTWLAPAAGPFPRDPGDLVLRPVPN